ncbi:MAG TPA: response regulator, partial [Alteromonas macleodii]|nr:response regulator [Alteromonas macleodii]
MGFNILICDDSALARKMARSNLPDGFAETIYEVSNGMDALEVLAHHTI